MNFKEVGRVVKRFSRRFQGCFKTFSRELQGRLKCFKGESRIIHRRLKEVSKVVLSSLKGALRLFQGNFKEFKSILSASIMFNDCLKHLGEFPIVSYLKVTDSTKSLVTFLVLVRGIFFLYHLKAYVYSFILSSGF